MRRIGFDIDDVIHDFGKKLIKGYNKETGQSLKLSDITKRDVCSILNIDLKQFEYLIDKYDIYRKGNVYEELMMYLALEQKGLLEVYYVTSRFKIGDVEGDTKSWLYRQGIKTDKVLFTNKTFTKGDYCNTLCLDVFVDDCITNLLDILEKSPGTQVYLYDRPRNRDEEIKELIKKGVDIKNLHKAKRIVNLQEIMKEGKFE